MPAGAVPTALPKERDDRRRQIISVVLDSGVEIMFYDASGIGDMQHARAAALKALVGDLADQGGQRLVLEQDDSLVGADEAVLRGAVRGCGSSLVFEHLPARVEPLLWVADAAAWCWARGGPWRSELSDVTRSVRNL